MCIITPTPHTYLRRRVRHPLEHVAVQNARHGVRAHLPQNVVQDVHRHPRPPAVLAARAR